MMADDHSRLTLGESEPVPSKKSGTMHLDLTSDLSLDRMRSRVWYLSPGDRTNYHYQREQEELYVMLDGPGRMRFGDEIRDIPEGSIIRVPPETRRQLLNDTGEGEHVWLVVGAPAVDGDGQVIDE